MCLARPVQVLKYHGDWVEVDDGHGHQMRVYAALLGSKGLKAGDYIFVHGELAVHKVPEDEALKIIALTESWALQ
ncbi:MAG: HypC/HybG/HupF family hydrogenase formation chaperone [Thermodesulfobacteriota bacterium]